MSTASTETGSQQAGDSSEIAAQILEVAGFAAQVEIAKKQSSAIGDEVAEAIRQGALQYLRSDIERTLQIAELLIQLAELTSNPNHEARGLWVEAHARSIGLGEYERSLELYDQASKLFDLQDEALLSARVRGGKLWALASLGRHSEAIAIGEAVAAILEKEKQKQSLAILNMNMGIIFSRLGDDVRALSTFTKARDLFEMEGNTAEGNLALSEMNRGIILRNLGRFAASISAISVAFEILADLNQDVEAARARQNLGITYYFQGRFNEALKEMDYARSVFLKDGRSRDAMLIDLFISECLLQLGRHEDVLQKCANVRETFDDIGASFEVAQILLIEGAALRGLERFQDACPMLHILHMPCWARLRTLRVIGAKHCSDTPSQ
jgi:tetratricopeptide (TPR) repeat protein